MRAVSPARLLLAGVLAAAAAPACDRAPQPRRQPAAAAIPPEVRAVVDSGNAAYRAGDYRGAMRHYREAVRRGPDQPVAWFGVQMAAAAVGDRAAADSAAAKLRELAPAPGDAHHRGGVVPHPAPPVPPRART